MERFDNFGDHVSPTAEDMALDDSDAPVSDQECCISN
jgi:hypothetical protein